MAAVANPAAPFVLTDGSIDPEAGAVSRFGRAVAPVIIGLVAPILLMLLIDPTALKHGRFLIAAVLMPAMLIAIAIYAYSVLNPGEVCGLVVKREAKSVGLVQVNIFASRVTEIPFADIANARIVAGYDQDGYATRSAELLLRDGQRLPLPAGTTDTEVRALRIAIGL